MTHQGHDVLTVPQMVGAKVRAARRASGLTLDEVAERMETSRTALLRLEQGRRHWPNFGTLYRVARVLGVPVADLVRDV